MSNKLIGLIFVYQLANLPLLSGVASVLLWRDGHEKGRCVGCGFGLLSSLVSLCQGFPGLLGISCLCFVPYIGHRHIQSLGLQSDRQCKDWLYEDGDELQSPNGTSFLRVSACMLSIAAMMIYSGST